MKESLSEPFNITPGEAEDRVHEMLLLAARLRESEGAELDDTAIAAVAEATGAPAEYVRLVLRTLPAEQKKKTLFERWKSSYLSFDPDVRRYVLGGLLGIGGAFLLVFNQAIRDGSGFMAMLVWLSGLVGLWNVVSATRSAKAASLTGAIHGATLALFTAFFAFIYQAIYPLLVLWRLNPGSLFHAQPIYVLVGSIVGGLIGAAAYGIVSTNRERLGLVDPAQERHRMLQQLVEITHKLKSDEQFVTFLSVDIVGSTKMKADADPLAIEFTFNEYHQFVEQIVSKNQGRIHSTAGDGVTCVFQNPAASVNAAKALLAGLFEFNKFRNRIGTPIQLRAGLHTGSVLAPGKELVNVNFSHVIDVSAHMQKAAPPGGLVVSEETARHTNGGMAALGDELVEVQGFNGVIWRPAARNIPVFTATAN